MPKGSIISSYCTEFTNLDGNGHGVHLETTTMTVRPPPLHHLSIYPIASTLTTSLPQPYAVFSQMHWRSGLAFKLAALRYRHVAAFISVARDRDAGRVYADPATGAPQIAYTPSAFDRAHMVAGVVALCRVLYVMGAREIDAFVDGVAPFIVDDDDDKAEKGAEDPRFTAWLDDVRRVGNGGAGAIAAASAHQMGTCRMSATEEGGVVDPRGKVWGVEGLYVADASVFPSASGVNPMVTVMAIADWIARAVDADLKGVGVLG